MEFNKRSLTTDEKKLVQILLNNINFKYSQLNISFSDSVVTLDDGGMGSFKFFYTQEKTPTDLGIIPISEYQFKDKDNVLVLVTLYSYSNGKLYELDIWKTDFSKLISYPN